MLLREGKKDRKRNDATFHGAIDTDAKISILARENPKKLNTACRNRFELYRDGQRVADFLSLGGTPLDVRWDFGREFIALDGKRASQISGSVSSSEYVTAAARKKPTQTVGPKNRYFDPSNLALVLQAGIEKQRTESALIPPNLNWRIAQRRETKLVNEYARALKEKGISAHAWRFPSGDGDALRCDVYDKTRNNLIEAKSNTLRGSIRMAIGERADYSRFLTRLSPRLAVLLPERPSPDLEHLLTGQKIGVVWKSSRGNFEDNSGGQFS